jgi:uncharacterized protein YfiM (DUF2279 family)
MATEGGSCETGVSVAQEHNSRHMKRAGADLIFMMQIGKRMELWRSFPAAETKFKGRRENR